MSHREHLVVCFDINSQSERTASNLPTLHSIQTQVVAIEHAIEVIDPAGISCNAPRRGIVSHEVMTTALASFPTQLSSASCVAVKSLLYVLSQVP